MIFFLLCSALAAENLEKTQKKELEAQVKTMTAEAQSLERSGQLAEARTKYAESQALIEVNEVTDAIKRLDEQIHKRVKDALNDSRKLYEAHKFKESAAVLDQAMKLEAFQTVLAYNLALCYHQLGDHAQALEYLRKAKAGTPEPKQKEKLLQLQTFFTTGENGLSVNDIDRDRILRVNALADSVGLEASLEDEGGAEESFSETDAASPEPSPPSSGSSAVPEDGAASGHAQRHPRQSQIEFVQCPDRAQGDFSRQSGAKPLIWQIVRSRTDEPPRPSGCWKNIWKCRPTPSMAENHAPASRT